MDRTTCPTCGPNDRADRYITPTEAAAHCGVSERTVSRWLKAEALPSHVLGVVRRIRVTDLDKFLADRAAF